MQEKNAARPKKKQPERKCLGCGETRQKKELARVVRTPDGSVLLDLTGRKSGRGAYVCKNAECLKKCRRRERLEQALGVNIPAEVYEAIEKELAENE